MSVKSHGVEPTTFWIGVLLLFIAGAEPQLFEYQTRPASGGYMLYFLGEFVAIAGVVLVVISWVIGGRRERLGVISSDTMRRP